MDLAIKKSLLSTFVSALAVIPLCAAPLVDATVLSNPAMKLDQDKFGRWDCGKTVFETVESSKTEFADGGDCSIHLKDSSCGQSNETLRFVFDAKELAAVKGKTVRLSAWIKKISGDNGIGLSFWLKRSNGEIQTKVEDVQAKGAWAKYSVTIEVPSDTAVMLAALGCANGWGRTGEAFFSKIALETVEETVNRKEVAKGEGSVCPLFNGKFLSQWSMKAWGGLSCERSEQAGKTSGVGLRIGAAKGATPFAGFSLFSSASNRNLDLSEYLKADGWLEFHIKPAVPMIICGKTFDLKSCGVDAGDGWRRCEIPLATLTSAGKLKARNCGELGFQLPNGLPAGAEVLVDGVAFAAKPKLPAPPFVFKNPQDEAFLAEVCGTPGEISQDEFTRPTIKNGTFLYKGAYLFLDGPWFDNGSLKGDFGPNSFKAIAADPDFCNKAFTKETADKLGLSSLQLSAAEDIPMRYALELPLPSLDNFRSVPSFYKGLGGMPIVVDFAWICYVAGACVNEPGFSKDVFQQNSSWHAFIPFCPEHPKGREIYRELMKRGAWFALKNGANPYVYEIFNESSYNCRCDYNKRSFLAFLKTRYGEIAKANEVWGTTFKDFEDAVFMKEAFETKPGVWADWCKFSGLRYADVLREGIAAIREVDKRPNVYFTEQLAFPHFIDFRGAGMDYTKVAEVSDVLCMEGGLKFGNSERPRSKGNEMEDVLNAGRHEYSMVADLFTALGKNIKPVVDHEHNCIRMDYGKRVPSRRSDIATSFWTQVFHGISSSYVYAWGRRAWEWNTFEEAKAQVINGGYKTSHLLNPYAYPRDFFEGFKDFKEELDQVKDIALPMPRLKAAKIAFVHSYPTLRMAGLPPQIDYAKILSSWYGVLLTAHYPFEALFEEDIASTDLSRYQALVIPCMKNSYAATLPALEKYVEHGGVVLCGNGSFTHDEYGKKLDSTAFLRSKKVHCLEKPEALVEALKAEGVAKYLELTSEDGKPIDDVEAQIIDRGDVKLVLLVNWLDEGVRLLRLKVNGLPSGFSAVDLSAKKSYAIEDSGVLLSLRPQTRLVLLFRKGEADAKFQAVSPAGVRASYQVEKTSRDMEMKAKEKLKAELAQEYRNAREYEKVDEAKCVFLDLRKAVNMGFKDEIDGDRKGGWFDQGSNDLRGMPLGRQVFSNIPFDIIDPAKNGGRSSLVLQGAARDYFPLKAEGLSVDALAKNIYFLHTAGWNGSQGISCMTYKIHYADGSSIQIPVEFGVKIGGWWNPQGLPEAKIAVDTENMVCKHVGLYCYRWSNPHPEKTISTLDVVSANGGAVPAVVAITLEKP